MATLYWSATKKWKKSHLAKRPDEFVPECFRVGNKGFKPEYEKECTHNMWKLISNEYAREWVEERNEAYVHIAYITRNPGFLERRFPSRESNRPKVKHLPIIKLKRFANVLGRVDTNLGRLHSGGEGSSVLPSSSDKAAEAQ